MRMIHEGQRLPLGVETGEDLPGIHAGLDDFQSDFPAKRLFLLGHINDPHSSLAENFLEFVRADHCADRGG